jgi:hypothetical protein
MKCPHCGKEIDDDKPPQWLFILAGFILGAYMIVTFIHALPK